MKVGILAVHGSIAEHAAALKQLKIEPIEVRATNDFKDLDGLILPGGESTTISDLSGVYALDQAIKDFAKSKKPVFGTCAGIILLQKFGLLDVTVDRNAYGRQIHSFEAETKISSSVTRPSTLDPRPFPLVCIRAPKITAVGKSVEVLAEFEGHPVFVKQGNVYGATFHPELTDDVRIHRLIFERRSANSEVESQ